jgi:NAD(P)H-hydrate epimerase
MNQEIPLPRLPERTVESHKASYGRVVLVGGSVGMSGAISLAGMAALRSGAGLVSICAPAACIPTIAAHEPCYMTIPARMEPQLGSLASEAEATIQAACKEANCVGIGPGLRCNEATTTLVNALYQQLTIPMVVDADALNCLALSKELAAAPATRILTPHPGEFRRLIDQASATVDECRQRAVEFAQQRNCILVLKGHRTLITDGERTAINATGNPGMATGGTGDVLTGLISGLVGQGLAGFEAAVLGTHLHGLAGDRAAGELGQHSLIASDLIRFLPQAFLEHAAGSQEAML